LGDKSVDEIAKYNQERWEDLARNNVPYSRPFLDLDEKKARHEVDPHNKLGDIRGKDVLCLAGGGGQQSAAFGLLGANVTVLDFSEIQLQRDRQTAEHYGHKVTTIKGDMRDLSCFDKESFDMVWHAHSLNFIPDIKVVFKEVAGVIRKGGIYRLSAANPFVEELWSPNWTGKGYLLTEPYKDGMEVDIDDTYWDISCEDGSQRKVKGPREFKHTLSTLVNGLIEQGFVIQGIWEHESENPDAEPGTLDHVMTIAPLGLTFLAKYEEK
jgi:2-polyprenyl-3-methyl-5-hydroxy-6-metoxy-1,4-benzoquinol methylase